MASPNLIDRSMVMEKKKKKFMKAEAVDKSTKDEDEKKKKSRPASEVRNKLYGSKE